MFFVFRHRDEAIIGVEQEIWDAFRIQGKRLL